MVSPHLLLSSLSSLKIENWYCRSSGISQELFPQYCGIMITLSNGDNYRFSWDSGQNSYYMNLLWDGEKLSGEEVTLYQNDEPTSLQLTVTIFKSPHPRLPGGWFGELSLNEPQEKSHSGEGNTGVFIAREDGTICEPKEASSRSADMGTSTAV